MRTRTYQPNQYRTSAAADRAAQRLTETGHRSAVAYCYGRYAAIDLDRTVVEIKEALFDLGFGSKDATTEAWRLLRTT